MEVAQADLFAPLVSLMEFRDFVEALDLYSECPYALGAAVFGPRRAARNWASRIRAGVVVVNDLIAPTADPRVPFGGRSQSGFGVTRGAEGLLELTQPRAILSPRGGWRPHYQDLKEGDEALFDGFLRARYSATSWQRLRGWFDLAGAAQRKAAQARGERGGK